MKPVAAIQLNDPKGKMFPHLKLITPILKTLFSRLFVSVTAVTQRNVPQMLPWLLSDSFFDVIAHQTDISVGEDFLTLYTNAATSCDPEQLIHLCVIDRVAFALQTEYREQFMEDVTAVSLHKTPLIFQRSPKAWATHPQNYYQFEQMITQTGEWLFGKRVDFAWCHIIFQAKQLQKIIPTVRRRDISFFAELVLPVIDEIQTEDVDWLSWEDPFLENRNPEELKQERECNRGETEKRLNYVIPMLELLKNYQ
ncbi:MAG: hypothetical protein GY943_24025 [Chloroflexi bacterium]|nr:hypothetical protein [Chloroflexota bacterium]